MRKLTFATLVPLMMVIAGCAGQSEDTTPEEDTDSASLSTAVTMSKNRWSQFTLTPAQANRVLCYNYCYSAGKTLASARFFYTEGSGYTSLAYAEAATRASEASLLARYPGAVCMVECETDDGSGAEWINFCPGSWNVAQCTAYGAY